MSSLPVSHDLTAYAGDTFAETFRFLEAGEPVDLTGDTVTAQARAAAGEPIELLVVVLDPPTDGQVTLGLPDGLEPGAYDYDIQVDAAGTVTTWVRGTLTIDPDVAAGQPPGTELLPDDLPPEQVAEIIGLARLALNAALYPCELPADPLPAPLELALAIVANRIYAASPEAGGATGQVVSESIGAYSYRYAAPETLDTAALVGGTVAKLIQPWNCKPGVYDISVAGSRAGWPVDWWQQDLDNPVKAIDAAAAP